MRTLFCLSFLLWSFAATAQSVAELDSLLDIDQASEADKRIILLISQIKESGDQSRLPEYLEVYGRIQLALHDDKIAFPKVDALIKTWDEILQTPKQRKELWRSATSWYEYLGLREKAYQAQLKVYSYAKLQPNITLRELGDIQVNLGSYSVNRMDIPAAKKHLAEAQKLLENDPDPYSSYRINSYLGNMAYFASKLDSAEYYYKKSIIALENSEPSPRNSFYRPALIYNNLAGVQSGQGKTSEAIASLNSVIDKLDSYVEVEKDPSSRLNAREFYFQAMDNLGAKYKGLGNYRKAQRLMEFSYEGKKRELGEGNINVCISEILLGQLYFDQAEPSKAKEIIFYGLQGLKNTEGRYLAYEADGRYTLARIEDYYGNDELAASHFHKAHELFKELLGDELDLIYLGFLKDYSTFLAENKDEKEAIRIAKEAHAYVKNNVGKSSLIAFEQELNIGEVYLIIGNYSEATKWGGAALSTIKQQLNNTVTFLDSLQNERYIPQAILLSTRSRFLSSENPSVDDLKSMVGELEEGLKVIERRKTFLDSDEDRSLLSTENATYFGFLEQLYLELYKKSPQQEYLARLLILHESALYQKIRDRLDQVDISRFGTIPATFFAEENKLKARLRKAITPETDGLEDYLVVISDWEKFLQNARMNYPEYYQFRYATLNHSMNDIWESLPLEATVVRYLQVGEELVALVLSKDTEKLGFFQLDNTKVTKILARYQQEWNNKTKTFSNLNELYQGLWAPLASKIRTQRVVIIPDGALFNLSFEILTPKLISDYSELQKNSLLSKNSISYHYSTLLFRYSGQPSSYQSNFVAFAPGFSDQMKDDYLSTVKDSLQIDRSYLRLIPQPFTDKLVDQLKGLLGGKVFSQKASTLSHFADEAGKHRILHIGTHAESDNISPEFSRLIFAKNTENEENSLFAKDIYQMDLSSELAVLIACETGKPSYQPGEGMISLAHAFNYAGSKSLLIGLWKIDEEASSKIAASFYEYLADGMAKDEALRQAKLDYLSIAQGRALSPEFWAGLITLGDSSPIALQPARDLKLFYFLGILVLLAVFAFYYRRKKIFESP